MEHSGSNQCVWMLVTQTNFKTWDADLHSPLYLNVSWSCCRMVAPSLRSLLLCFLPGGKGSVKEPGCCAALLSHLAMSPVLEPLWHLTLLGVNMGQVVQEATGDVPYRRGNFLLYTD